LLIAHGAEWTWGQVLVQRGAHGFDLRHVADRDQPAERLKLLRTTDLRVLAQDTATGEFRPLKSAPTLAPGWRAHVGSAGELEFALNTLYPGSLADWFAARSENPPITGYRDFTRRQSGMYRITALLSDAQAAQLVRAICPPAGCLKRRLWTVDGLPADAAEAKSSIPCLEPCALLLEFARKMMRIEQQEPLNLALHPDDAASAIAALERVLANSPDEGRAADVSNPGNSYRLRLVREKLRDALTNMRTLAPAGPVEEE
jgi:hypothetical protein